MSIIIISFVLLLHEDKCKGLCYCSITGVTVYLLKNYFKGTGNKVRAGEGGRLQEGTTMLGAEQGTSQIF